MIHGQQNIKLDPFCRLSHCDVEGKDEPPLYDFKAATKVQSCRRIYWLNIRG
jgi:hypothetical protein